MWNTDGEPTSDSDLLRQDNVHVDLSLFFTPQGDIHNVSARAHGLHGKPNARLHTGTVEDDIGTFAVSDLPDLVDNVLVDGIEDSIRVMPLSHLATISGGL